MRSRVLKRAAAWLHAKGHELGVGAHGQSRRHRQPAQPAGNHALLRETIINGISFTAIGSWSCPELTTRTTTRTVAGMSDSGASAAATSITDVRCSLAT